MEYIKPTIEEFKIYFSRDFPFQPPVTPPEVVNPDLYIQDADIAKAFLITDANLILGCFTSQEAYTISYMDLAAHYLVMSLRASAGGISGTFSWGATSKSVGSVSISNTIPDSILQNPTWAVFAQTPYGVNYLISIIPCLVGRFFVVPGRTHA